MSTTTTTPTRPFLQVRDLEVHFSTPEGVVRAVDGVSFTLERGRTLGVVGESGSGKSVTGQAILGLNRTGGSGQTAGSILLDGEDLLDLPEEAMRRLRGNRVAMVFQDPLSALHPYYTVGSQIVEAIRVHRSMPARQCRARAAEMFELVGIPDPRRRLDQYPHEFSGGMCQRAMIAMALVNEPELLVADEPTTALDVTVQAQVLQLLRDVQQEFDTAIMIVTHDLGVVAALADEILVMYAGRVVERGTTRRVFGNPEHPYTWGLLASMPGAEPGPRAQRLAAIRGNPPSLVAVPTGCAFHPRCDHLARVPEGRCRLVEPVLEPTDADHLVTCHLPADLRRELGTAVADASQEAGR